jgi:uroporphyrinogen-III decarboxylase
MTSKERLLCALDKGKPDRMPVSIHQWQKYHLDKYLDGISELEAFKQMGMDAQIQLWQGFGQYWLVDGSPTVVSTPQWQYEAEIVGDADDSVVIQHAIRTPEGRLTYKSTSNAQTTWIVEYMIKRDEDIELIRKYMPVPKLDVNRANSIYESIGDDGILRGFVWGEQAGCWQHACLLKDVSQLMLDCFDKPQWVHELLSVLLDKKLQFIETMEGAMLDVVETGGGAASSTLISPSLHKEFCLPYDRKMHEALHSLGFKVTYHTCGGTLGIEETIIANGADASETLAPPSIGGNQEPWEFKAKTGGRIALIGGVDQMNTLTIGTQRQIRDTVFELFQKVGQDGGYICSAADHFFETPPENLKIFANAARECVY